MSRCSAQKGRFFLYFQNQSVIRRASFNHARIYNILVTPKEKVKCNIVKYSDAKFVSYHVYSELYNNAHIIQHS